MKKNWFISKICYEKTAEDGKIEKVNEQYLFDAISFTEAEERTIDEMKPFISGEFSIEAVKKIRISEILFHPECEKWYRTKVNFVVLDEERGVEKKVPVTMFVQADDISQAIDFINHGMKGTMSDYIISSIQETDILAAYTYEE